mgnify:CR=1 FL=1
MTSEGIVYIVTRAHSLTSLRLRALGVKDVCIEAIAQHCPRLRTLDVQNCHSLTFSGGLSLVIQRERCVFWETLRIFNIVGLRLSTEQLEVVKTGLHPEARVQHFLEEDLGGV